MDYKRIYDNLCSSRKCRGITKGAGFEVHHILPVCMGGNNHASNLVKLTYREHLIAHKLLVKIYPTNSKLKSAVFIMMSSRSKHRGEYDKLKEMWPSVVKKAYLDVLVGDHTVGFIPRIQPRDFKGSLSLEDINNIKGYLKVLGKPVTNTRIQNLSLLWRFLYICRDSNVDCIHAVGRLSQLHQRVLKVLVSEGKLSVIDNGRADSYYISGGLDFLSKNSSISIGKSNKCLSGCFFSECRDSKGYFTLLPWVCDAKIIESLGDLCYKPRKLSDLKKLIKEK